MKNNHSEVCSSALKKNTYCKIRCSTWRQTTFFPSPEPEIPPFKPTSTTAPPAKSKTPNKTRRQTGKNIHKIKMEAMRCLLNLLLYFLCAFNFLFLSRELSKPREKRATAAAAASTGLLCFLYGFRITFSLRGARSALSSCVACFFRRRRRRSMQQQASNDFYTSRHFYRFSLMLFTFL